jgi:hypothetical protein
VVYIESSNPQNAKQVPAHRHRAPLLSPDLTIHAELIGSDVCTAAGITVRSATPVLALCRRLIATGHDSATALHVYRGNTLALRVRSIGEAADLEIDGKGCGFKRRAAVGIAPLVCQNGGGGG